VNIEFSRIRSRSTTRLSVQRKLLDAVLVVFLGALLGYLAKFFDGTPVVGQIGTNLGVWILIGTLLAALARSPRAAAVHVLLFFAAMLIVYYIYTLVLFGFFPMYYFKGWGTIALISPLGAYLVWYARGEGWLAALCAAAPISLILAEGIRFFTNTSAAYAFDLLAALLLLFVLGSTWRQRVKITLIAAALSLIVWKLRLLSLFYFR